MLEVELGEGAVLNLCSVATPERWFAYRKMRKLTNNRDVERAQPEITPNLRSVACCDARNSE